MAFDGIPCATCLQARYYSRGATAVLFDSSGKENEMADIIEQHADSLDEIDENSGPLRRPGPFVC